MSGERAPIFDLLLDSRSGTRLGRFEVICKLGAGGMSEVFLASQRSLGGFNRPVVLKRILKQVQDQQAFVQMFVQEAKITSNLNHGNIAQLHDLSEEEGELFMVIEFVPGATLVEVGRACANANEPMPIGLSLAVVRETALALHYAHTFKDTAGRPRPVIHRDVAGKNIMLSLDGKTKLLDFGIARQSGTGPRTHTGTVKGTLGYMSPEQMRGEKLDCRTDVYSLGVVLHECLTGQRLFKVGSMAETIESQLRMPIPNPSHFNPAVSRELDAVVQKALSRDLLVRYETAAELVAELDRVCAAVAWSEDKRAEFMARHFARRREQIRGLLGDPGQSSVGDTGELRQQGKSQAPAVGDDEHATEIAPMPQVSTESVSGPARTDPSPMAEGSRPTRSDRADKSEFITNPVRLNIPDAWAVLPEPGDDTNSDSWPGRVPGVPAPGGPTSGPPVLAGGPAVPSSELTVPASDLPVLLAGPAVPISDLTVPAAMLPGLSSLRAAPIPERGVPASSPPVLVPERAAPVSAPPVLVPERAAPVSAPPVLIPERAAPVSAPPVAVSERAAPVSAPPVLIPERAAPVSAPPVLISERAAPVSAPPVLIPAPPSLVRDPDERTVATSPAGLTPRRRRGWLTRDHLQVLGMIGGAVAVVVLILMMLFL